MRDTEFGDRAVRHRWHFRRKFIFIPFIAAGVLALVSYIVMQLWNHLLPGILHTGTIDFWQAMGLFVLAKILFGFGHGGRGGRGGPWMQHKMERFKNMSPEEQERFREQMRQRCGKWGRHPGGFYGYKAAGNTEKSAEETSKPAE
jgi:hypothetical protein